MPVVGHKCSTLPLHYLVSFVLCSSRKNLLVSVEFGKMINKLLEVSTMSEYQSNVSREQFELIWPGLEGLRKLIGIRSRHYDLYNVFNAILYSLTTGCRWRELPHDFSEWHTVYRYCDMWRDKPDPTVDFLLERVLNLWQAVNGMSILYTKRSLSDAWLPKQLNQRTVWIYSTRSWKLS